MAIRVLLMSISSEKDVVAARQRARQIAKLCCFADQDQIRIATSVSELARNAYEYAGGGLVRFAIEGETAPQILMVDVEDQGPGIADLDSILAGTYISPSGLGTGLLGAKRLMDRLDVDTRPGKGTHIRMQKLFASQAPVITAAGSATLFAGLATLPDDVALTEALNQNQELLSALAELKCKQDDLLQLTQELEDTNRGVVALYAELDEKAERLRQADTTKSRFLSNISHELRTPLSSIRALAKLLLDRVDGELSTEQEKQVAFILQAATTLTEMVNDLLDIAKIESGKVDVRPAPVDVTELFSTLRGMLRPLLMSDSVKLVFEEPPTPLRIDCDEGKLAQILRNFISNALKYTEAGSITVSATPSACGREIQFSVADTGIGISPNDLELIFEEFSQVEHALQRKVKGTGLGLPLCRNLAKLLGGNVAVSSEVGTGSIFSVTLPTQYARAPRASATELGATADPARPAAMSLPILVVSPDAAAHAEYRELLSDSAFNVAVASSAREADRAWHDRPPAAVILDLSLQDQEGWTWLVDLKNNRQRGAVPVVLVAQLEDIRKGRSLGADAHFVRPLTRTQFVSTLRALTAYPPVSSTYASATPRAT